MKPSISIEEYISLFPDATQERLRQVYAIIKKAAPKAEEAMKYGIPTFVTDENLIHFAGYKKHIGLYPTPSLIKAFAKELLPYKTAKGSVQFPLDRPLPVALIKKIVTYRVKQNKLAVKL